MCPRTSGQSVDDANIECLALGWELSCASDQVTLIWFKLFFIVLFVFRICENLLTTCIDEGEGGTVNLILY